MVEQIIDSAIYCTTWIGIGYVVLAWIEFGFRKEDQAAELEPVPAPASTASVEPNRGSGRIQPSMAKTQKRPVTLTIIEPITVTTESMAKPKSLKWKTGRLSKHTLQSIAIAADIETSGLKRPELIAALLGSELGVRTLEDYLALNPVK